MAIVRGCNYRGDASPMRGLYWVRIHTHQPASIGWGFPWAHGTMAGQLAVRTCSVRWISGWCTHLRLRLLAGAETVLCVGRKGVHSAGG